MTRDQQLRFLAKVAIEDPTGCWIWTAARGRDGYGKATVGYKTVAAHRVSYELWRGEIPDGHEVDHLCKIPLCVNPWHLEPVTRLVNSQRSSSPAALNGRKTHCTHGHAFDEKNTYWWRGKRACRKCARRRETERRRIHGRPSRAKKAVAS